MPTKIEQAAKARYLRKPRHQLDMRGMTELIDRRHALQPVAAVDQDTRVAGEGCGIARDRNHHADLACRELKALRLRALARRIEHDRIVVAQFLRHQRTPEQVARLGFQRLQPRRRGCRLLQCFDRAGIIVERRDARPCRQPQRKRPDPAEQIGDVFGAPGVPGDQRRQRLFAGGGRLQERARRQRDLRGSDSDRGRLAHQHQLAMPRQPRQAVLFGDNG